MADKQLILGIIGHPVGHSLSPLMHNTAMKHWGMDGCYVPFEVKPKGVAQALSGLRALGVEGVNVTIPHKQAVIEYLDELDPPARAIGAVNTIKFSDSRAVGFNTDGSGFVASLKEDAGQEVQGMTVLLIGAGGAARGIAVKLAMEGAAEIRVANRTVARGRALVEHLRSELSYGAAESVALESSSIGRVLSQTDIVINTTSVGMNGKGGMPISPEGIDEHHLVCDIVYTPLETAFLKECRRRGARTLDGLGMLIHQGDLAFQIWTDKNFPPNIIRDLLIKKLFA